MYENNPELLITRLKSLKKNFPSVYQSLEAKTLEGKKIRKTDIQILKIWSICNLDGNIFPEIHERLKEHFTSEQNEVKPPTEVITN